METTPASANKTQPGSLLKSSLTPCRRLGLSRPSSGNLKRSLLLSRDCTPKTKEQIVENKSSQARQASINDTPIHSCVERLKAPSLSETVNKNRNYRSVRRRLTASPKTPKLDFTEKEDVLQNEKFLKTDTDKVKDPEEDIHILKKRRQNPSNCDEKTENGNVNCSFPPVHSSSVVICSDSELKLEEATEEITPQLIEKLVASLQEKKQKIEQLKIQELFAKKNNLEELRAQTAKWKKAGQEALRYAVDLAKQAGYSVTIKQLMAQHSFPLELMGYNSEDDEFQEGHIHSSSL